MKCWQARQLLMKLSPEELEHPVDPSFAEHLNHCPSCDTERQLYINMMKDVKIGAEFNPDSRFWSGFSIPDTLPESRQLSDVRSVLQKIDWILAPEKTLKWAAVATVLLFSLVGVISIQIPKDRPISTLPNRLIIRNNLVTITEDTNSGIRIIPNALNAGIRKFGNSFDNRSSKLTS